jgi:hypothetical protein
MMPPTESRIARCGLVVALTLLGIASAVSVAAAVLEPPRQTSTPEAVVRGYFAALEAGDASAALMRISPTARAEWASFVENGVLNEYRVVGVAVRQAAAADRLSGAPEGPQDVTAFVEITEAVSGERWRAGPRVSVVLEDGIWYLTRPPLAH